MIDPEAWLGLHRQEREREIQARHREARAHQGQPPEAPLGTIRRTAGRTLGRALVRVGLWLMVPGITSTSRH